MLEWVAISFFRRSSQHRDGTQISCIAGRFFTNWAPREAWFIITILYNVLCLVSLSCLILWDHMDCSLPGSSVHGDSPGKNTGVGCHALLVIFNNRVLLLTQEWQIHGMYYFLSIEYMCVLSGSVMSDCDPMGCSPPGSSVLWECSDSPGKNTGVGCHALLQNIFPTQGSSPSLLHCRWFFTVWATREAQRAPLYIYFPMDPHGTLECFSAQCSKLAS